MTTGLLYFPLRVLCLQHEFLFDCRCILVGKRGISFLSLDLFKLCMTSIYAESGIYHFKWYDIIHSWKRCREPLLYFVIYIVTEYTGSSQKKACFSGISKFCEDCLFLLYQNILDSLKVYWPKNVSRYLIPVLRFFFAGKKKHHTRQKCKTGITSFVV